MKNNMKKALLATLFLGTLSANAGSYFNGGLGYQNQKFSFEGKPIASGMQKGIKPAGLLLTIGAGQMQDLENNLFLGYGFDLSLSRAKDKKTSGIFSTEVKSKVFADLYMSFGYKINNAISTYAKLGVSVANVSIKDSKYVPSKYVPFRNPNVLYQNGMGLMYGLGMSYMVNTKGAVYAELLKKNQKLSEDHELSTNSLTVGYRYFF